MAKKLFSVFFSFLLIVQCSSCGKTLNKYSEYSFEYFDTVTTITGYERSKEEFDDICEEIMAQLEKYHQLFNIYLRYDGIENLCTINELENGVHRTVKVDKCIIEMLKYSKEMYVKTEGKVNIAMGSVLSIWHEYRQSGISEPWNAKLPPMEKLREASAHTNIDNLVIDEEKSTVTITDPEMTLDVGAIAKGYAVEMIAQNLEKKGISGYVINVGGNVRTVGDKGNGEKWTVGIENPQDDDNNPYLFYASLCGEALVTSGSYQRYYIVDGKKYHHIIDPETLLPSDRYLSVSIICESSADGDALSTALFCMDYEKGLALIESLPDIEAMWVFTSGEIKKSSDFSNYTK